MAQVKAQVDKLLTNVSNGLFPGKEDFLCERLFPEVSVKQSSGKIGKYGKEHLRVNHTMMGGRGSARRVEVITRSSDSYLLENHGLEGLVTRDDYSNVEEPFQAESDETVGLTVAMLVDKEYALSSVLSDTAQVTQNATLSGSTQLSDYNNSNPIEVFKTARYAIKDGIGVLPNVAFMDEKVADTLSFHPGILASLGYNMNRAGSLSYDEIAKALKVQRLLIARSIYNTAKEGQTDSLSAMWGKHIWFGQLPEKAIKYGLSAGYHVKRDGFGPRQVSKYAVNNPSGATAILCEDDYDYVITDVSGLYLIKNAIA